MATTLEHICKNTYTAVDLHRRLGLLQECLEEVLYHSASGFETAAVAGAEYAHKVGSESDAKALREWGDEVWGTFHAHNLADQVNALKKEGESLPVLAIYLPVAFDTDSIEAIGSWCRKNVNPHLLLEPRIDPTVVGGCAFVANDTYHDFSLHKAMQSNKGIVSELLTSYAKK